MPELIVEVTMKTFVRLLVAYAYLWIIGTASAKVIDLRTMTNSKIETEINFCVRESPDTVKNLPGHAFVGFSQKEAGKDRIFIAIGHTLASGTSTTSAVWSFVNAVNGLLKEENYTAATVECLTVKVDEPDYDRAFALTKNPLDILGLKINAPVIESYRLGINDCETFMISVARTLESKGLKIPKRLTTDLPFAYLKKLIKAN
jgi:hypothetical protein